MSAATYLPRSAWNARAARPGPGALVPSRVEGIAFHWPGATTSRPISKAAVPRALRGWQDFHMDGRGWSDIAYQVAVDQWGRVWTLRGLTTQSGANGDQDVNRRYCAVLLVLVEGETPSAAMTAAVAQVVDDLRRLYPHARRLVGHGQIRPGGGTECPGPAVRAALAHHAFDAAEHPATAPEGDEMQTSDKIANWDPEHDRKGDSLTVGKTLNQARGYAAAAYRRARSTDARLDAVEAQLREVLALLRAQ